LKRVRGLRIIREMEGQRNDGLAAGGCILVAAGDLEEERANLRIRKVLRQRFDGLAASAGILVAAGDFDEERANLRIRKALRQRFDGMVADDRILVAAGDSMRSARISASAKRCARDSTAW